MDSNLPPVSFARKSNYRPILLTLLISFLLGGGSCFGFVATANGNSAISSFFAVGFGLCVLAFLGSISWLVTKAVRDGLKG
jgi:hypothetical protein